MFRYFVYQYQCRGDDIFVMLGGKSEDNAAFILGWVVCLVERFWISWVRQYNEGAIRKKGLLNIMLFESTQT